MKILTFGTLLILSVTLVFADQGSRSRRHGDRQDWNRERIETVIIGKFAEELELTPEQAERFFPRYRQLRVETDELRRQQDERSYFLGEMSKSAAVPEQANLPKVLDEQQQSTAKMAELRRVFLSDISNFLTPQQVSRCALLLDELPRRLRTMVQEHQRDAGPPADSPGRSLRP